MVRRARDAALRSSIGAAVVVAGIVACLPFFRFVGWLGDEGILPHGALRLARGEVLYHDFFEFFPPLPFLLVAGWQRLLGDGFVALRVLAVATIVLVGALTYRVCARVSGSRGGSAGLAIAYLFASQGWWTVINHRWFAAVFVLAAVALALRLVDAAKADPPMPALAAASGLCLGAAVLVTPTTGLFAVALFAGVAAARRPLRELAALTLASLIVPAACTAYLIAHHALRDALGTIFGFLAHHYAGIQSLPFGTGSAPQSYLLVALFPAAFAAAGLRLVVAPRATLADARFRTLLFLAVAGFLYAFPRADVSHIGYGAPLACLLLADCLAHLGASLAPGARLAFLRRPIGLGAAVLAASSVLGWCPSAARALALPLTPTPAGDVRFGPQTDPAELGPLIAAIADLPAGDRVSFYPYDPTLIVLCERRHVAPLDHFTPGYTTARQYRQSCDAVLDGSDWVVIDRLWADPVHIQRIWPAVADPSPPEKLAFERAVDEGFDLVRGGRFELRRRKPGASRAACSAIADTLP